MRTSGSTFREQYALEGCTAAHTGAHLCLVGLENHIVIIRILADASAVREQTLCPGGPWALHLLQTAHTISLLWARRGERSAPPCRPADHKCQLNSAHLHM